MATGDVEQIEEERRLLSVAMTRARDHLYGYFPMRYHHTSGRGRLDDRHSYAQPSRFLSQSVLDTLDRSGDAPPARDPRTVHEPLADVDSLLLSLLD
jgi:superfamily I DNA/RNA helicase